MILKEIAQNPMYKQRDISRETGLNLMKVNIGIRRLVQKGYVTRRNVYKNSKKLSYEYALTRSGNDYKSFLIYKFIKYSLDLYGSLESTFHSNIRLLIDDNCRKIILFGDRDTMRLFHSIALNYDMEIVDSIMDETVYAAVGENHDRCLANLVANKNYDSLVFLCINNINRAAEIVHASGIPEEKLWLMQ